MEANSLLIRGLEGIPEIAPGTDLGNEILKSLARRLPAPPHKGASLASAGIIFVVAQKVVSKSEGCVIPLDSVVPSTRALEYAAGHQKDPRIVEVVFSESRRMVRMERGILIAETHHGFICANAGVDTSNAPPGCVITLPRDPDGSAERLRRQLQDSLQISLAVIISDTFGRPWRRGLTNVALGVAGIAPFMDYRGQVDSSGRTLQATILAVADELAAAAELVMGKTSRIPVATIEGFCYKSSEGAASQIIRAPDEDLFR